MLNSMTAFGDASAISESGELSCEIRSVNHRYLDVGVRVASEVRPAESLIREKLTQRLRRGKIEVSIRFTPSAAFCNQLQVDTALVDELLQAADEVSNRGESLVIGGSASLDIVSLMQWPGVISTVESDKQELLSRTEQVFDEALDDLIATRAREGEQIRQVLTQRNQQVQAVVSRLRDYRPAVLEGQRERLLQRLEKLAVEPDRDRLEQELVYLAQRLDIEEELDRLDAHVKEFFNVLERDEAVGRRLDFLLQEFNREANTIGSKSSHSETTADTVNLKVLIEQMREQVQNVE